MRSRRILPVALVAAVLCFGYDSRAGAQGGQSFVSAGAAEPVIADTAGKAATPDTPRGDPYAEGTAAINQSRWADAVQFFTTAADQHGDKADGALYWKAYAQDKLSQDKQAEETCAALRSGYPSSKWIDDCGALEVEIDARAGKRITIEPGQSDDVKLLALNAMLRQDEPRALAEIQAILNGEGNSEHLRKEAQFILGQHYSNVTYGQIVRVSYVEGDVRVQRGEPLGKGSDDVWEKAATDLPLETGFSLVTGNGRAEIELENASTLYVAENSVLTFNDLEVTAGVPFTEMALLSGTVTLHIRPYVAGERFVLHTPTSDFTARYPDRSYARIEAYTDAVAITPLEGKEFSLPGVPREEIRPGHTWTYEQGLPWAEENPDNDTAPSAFDQWVSERVTQRDAAIASVMQASGLTAPIPGMAELDGQGTFMDCAPYGTCWEPKDVAAEDQTARGSRMEPGLSRGPHLVFASFDPSGRVEQDASAQAQRIMEREDDFPCMPNAVRYRMTKDPVTGKETVIDRQIIPSRSYAWGVCHAGTWIRHKRHYLWVVGTKRHHICPIRWVKSGKAVGFVPLHPFDVKGQPAINVRHTVFTVSGRPNNLEVHAVRFEPGLSIEYLKEAPKEFRVEPMRPLALAEAPRMEARSWEHAGKAPGEGRSPGKPIEIAKGTAPIHFDAKTHSFTMAHQQLMRDGHTATVFAPMTNRSGTLQARGESFSGSGSHGGWSGGGGSHVSGGGSSGSSHSSGGSSSASSGGGGGSHSSGSVSSGSSSSSSSGGGAHH